MLDPQATCSALSRFRDNILFKGGTSLSKIFNAIHRFSEDIDLAINFEMLGFTGPRHPSAAPSRNKRQKILERNAHRLWRLRGG